MQRAGLPEMVDSQAFVRIVAGRSQHGLKLVLLNGCRSLHLAIRLVHAGLPCAVGWETAVPVTDPEVVRALQVATDE